MEKVKYDKIANIIIITIIIFGIGTDINFGNEPHYSEKGFIVVGEDQVIYERFPDNLSKFENTKVLIPVILRNWLDKFSVVADLSLHVVTMLSDSQ